MGLPLRIALPVFIVLAAIFVGIMAYLVQAGLGEGGTALGRSAPAEPGQARIGSTPAPIATDLPGTFAIPQTGTGPAGGSNALPGNAVGGGGPPAAVGAMLDDLRARLKANPNDLAALVGLGDAFFEAGKYDGALPYFRRALALDPGNPDVRADEATALHKTGHDLEALRELDVVIHAHPDFNPALYDRGVVLAAVGRRAEALAAFKRFIAVAPNDPRAADARAAIGKLGG